MHKPNIMDQGNVYGDREDGSLQQSNHLVLPIQGFAPRSPASTPSGPSDPKRISLATMLSCSHSATAPPPPPPPESPAFSSPSTPGTPGSVKALELLPPDYEPGQWDVICQRGKTCDDHIGNRRFRLCVENHVPAYLQANNRQAKSDVISSVVRSIRRATGRKGGFVMKDPKSKRWHHVDSKVARDKVGNALRDAVKQLLESKCEDNLLGKLSHTSSMSLDTAAKMIAPASDRSFSLGAKAASTIKPLKVPHRSISLGARTFESLKFADEVAARSAALEPGMVAESTLAAATPAAVASCPALHATNTRPLFLKSSTTNDANLGIKNDSWGNFRVQSSRLQQNFSANALANNSNSFMSGQGMMNWNNHNLGSHGQMSLMNIGGGMNAANVPAMFRSMPELPISGMNRALSVAGTAGTNHSNGLFASLLSNDLSVRSTMDTSIGSTFDFNRSDVLMNDEDLTAARSDNAEQLSKDIDDFLRSVRESATAATAAAARAPLTSETTSEEDEN